VLLPLRDLLFNLIQITTERNEKKRYRMDGRGDGSYPSTGFILRSGPVSTWLPFVHPNDPFTGAFVQSYQETPTLPSDLAWSDTSWKKSI
jgi:hypothetical protein